MGEHANEVIIVSADRQEWDDVADAARALALKLRLHFEQTASGSAGDAKSAVDAVASAVESAFDGLRAAVEDPAVKQDVQAVAASLRSALSNMLHGSG